MNLLNLITQAQNRCRFALVKGNEIIAQDCGAAGFKRLESIQWERGGSIILL